MMAVRDWHGRYDVIAASVGSEEEKPCGESDHEWGSAAFPSEAFDGSFEVRRKVDDDGTSLGACLRRAGKVGSQFKLS